MNTEELLFLDLLRKVKQFLTEIVDKVGLKIVISDRTNVTDVLIKNGANIELADYFGLNPLMTVIVKGNSPLRLRTYNLYNNC